MKKIILLLVLVFTATLVLAQHKTMTVYYSGGTTDVVNLTNTDSIIIFICGASKVNYGGKAYNTVLIGNQCWLKENLDIGTMVQGFSNQLDNGILEKYCHNNDPNNCNTYGGLYQWNEAMQYVTTEGAQGICPPGWHIPKLTEFQTLAAAVNNDGNALKREDQGSGSGQGTNASGFSAWLAGLRNWSGYFSDLGIYTTFWSSTDNTAFNAYRLAMNGWASNIYLNDYGKTFGISVRCLKD